MRGPFFLGSLLLAGCNTVIPVEAPAPANAMQACPKPREVPKGAVDLGQLLDYTIKQVQDYKECRKRHAALIEYTQRKQK